MIEPAHDFRQIGIVNIELKQMFVGVAHIGGIVAIDPDPLLDEAGHFVHGQAARILAVAAVDDIGERVDATAFGKSNADGFFQIDRRDEFALAQIVDRPFTVTPRDAESDPLAGAAPVEPENEARTFGSLSPLTRTMQ